jgi:predicted extracellular nuclease
MFCRNSFILTIFSALLLACDGGGVSTPVVASVDDADQTTIADIQGDGPSSPFENKSVTVVGIVTGDFQDNDANSFNDLGGFYVQSETPDSSETISDGIFVLDSDEQIVDISVGDRVSVKGIVKEHFGETQITAVSVSIEGNGRIEATELRLPAASVIKNSDDVSIADLEHLEGMLVHVAQTLTVTDIRNLERYGELRLAADGRLYQFTNKHSPSESEYDSYRDVIASRTLMLDDGRRDQNRSPIRYLENATELNGSLRVGDSVAGLTGVLGYSRGSGGNGTESWRLMPTSKPKFVASNPRPGAPDVAGTLRVASFNVLNFFSKLDTGENICGPEGRSSCRGANSVEELSRQLEKSTTAISMMDADIVGLIELENNARGSLTDIVDSLNAELGEDTYAILDIGSIGNDGIKTGFVYRPANVSPYGKHALLNSRVDERFQRGRNRDALAQGFEQKSNGARLTVVVNHLKSKGSSCEDTGDPNTGDGQGNCNKTRTSAAEALVDWIRTDPTGSGDPDYLVIGDLNAHLQEDPLVVFGDAGFVNLIDQKSSGDAYSFIFEGQSGALDHALASPSLAPQVSETIEWHINADESPAHDYNLEYGRDPDIFDGSLPYRASDHDPIIIGLDLKN